MAPHAYTTETFGSDPSTDAGAQAAMTIEEAINRMADDVIVRGKVMYASSQVMCLVSKRTGRDME